MKLKIALITFTIIALLGGYLAASVPFMNINKLNGGYVQVSLKNDVVSYKVVNKRPRKWSSISSMPQHVYYSFVVSEDWSFYSHQGVDLRQIFYAVKDHLQGEKLRGASTISQQLAKNLYTRSERSLVRKVFELFTTMYLETRLSKNKILETYLNIIEFGENLYGITDASWFYFKKRPSDLGPKESAFLAMLLPNPKIYSQSFRDKKLSEYANKTVNSILKRLKITKMITEDELVNLQNTSLPFENVDTAKSKKVLIEEEFFEL